MANPILPAGGQKLMAVAVLTIIVILSVFIPVATAQITEGTTFQFPEEDVNLVMGQDYPWHHVTLYPSALRVEDAFIEIVTDSSDLVEVTLDEYNLSEERYEAHPFIEVEDYVFQLTADGSPGTTAMFNLTHIPDPENEYVFRQDGVNEQIYTAGGSITWDYTFSGANPTTFSLIHVSETDEDAAPEDDPAEDTDADDADEPTAPDDEDTDAPEDTGEHAPEEDDPAEDADDQNPVTPPAEDDTTEEVPEDVDDDLPEELFDPEREDEGLLEGITMYLLVVFGIGVIAITGFVLYRTRQNQAQQQQNQQYAQAQQSRRQRTQQYPRQQQWGQNRNQNRQRWDDE